MTPVGLVKGAAGTKKSANVTMFPLDPLEEIAYGLGYAAAAQLRRLAEPLNSNGYEL